MVHRNMAKYSTAVLVVSTVARRMYPTRLSTVEVVM
jgi:hypothetical protein